MVKAGMKSISFILIISMIGALVMPLTGTPHVCEHHPVAKSHTMDCCSMNVNQPADTHKDATGHNDHQHNCTYLCTCGCHVLAFTMQFFSFSPASSFTILDQQLTNTYSFDYFVSVWQPPRLG